MDLSAYMAYPGERPLDRTVSNGGLFRIFRTFACVGDSLSSGEFESCGEDGKSGYHDMYEYSWGQFMARAAGSKCYNFSCGGMTAKVYCESFADSRDLWNKEKAAQAYIIALGVNDLLNCHWELGSTDDVCLENRAENKKTFAGYYAQIIQRYKEISPRARFFLMTMPTEGGADTEKEQLKQAHADLLYKFAEMFDRTYVLDLYKYAPVYDETFRDRFFMSGHMTADGYIFTADMVSSYIDYIIRANYADFKQVPFIGTDLHNLTCKD